MSAIFLGDATHLRYGVPIATGAAYSNGNSLQLARASAQYVTIDKAVFPYTIDDNVSVSAWIYIPAVGASGFDTAIFGNVDVADNGGVLMLARYSVTDDLIFGWTNLTGGYYQLRKAAVGWTVGWHHVVFVNPGVPAGSTMYLDGAQVVGFTNTGGGGGVTSFVSPNAFRIGRAGADAGFDYQGNIDEFTIWNVALTAANVTALYGGGHPTDPTSHVFSTGLVNYYKMGDPPDTSATVADRAGALNGTCINSPTISTNTP